MTRLVIAVLVASTLALCPVAAASTPAQYRSEVRAICMSADRKLDSEPTPKSPKQFSAYFKVALAVLRMQYGKLGKLKPPKAFRAAHAAALAMEKKQIDAIQAGVSKMDAGGDPMKVFMAMDKKATPLYYAEAAAWDRSKISCRGGAPPV